MPRHYPAPDVGAVYYTDQAPYDYPTARSMTLTVHVVSARFITVDRAILISDEETIHDSHRISRSGWVEMIRFYQTGGPALHITTHDDDSIPF